MWDEWRSTVCFVWTAGTRRNNPTGSICLPYIFQLFLLESDVRAEDLLWFSLFSVLFTENSWGGRISSHISELLIKTWGVEGPGDEREDTIPPPSETEDVLRQYKMDWELLKFVELFEFRREKSFEVRREDSVFKNINFTHLILPKYFHPSSFYILKCFALRIKFFAMNTNTSYLQFGVKWKLKYDN